MIARWIERGPWAGGPLCFSSSGGWERLMDPNWTHIYCARFSWSVTGMMMPQLEPLTGWLCMPFWKVVNEYPPLLATVILLSKHKCPAAIWENHLMLWRKGWWRLDSSVVVEAQCNNNPFSLWKKNARMCETTRRVRKLCFEMSVEEPETEHKVIFTPVCRAKCEQSREAC